MKIRNNVFLGDKRDFVEENKLSLKKESKRNFKIIKEIHSEVFSLLKKPFGRKSNQELLKDFENNLIRNKYLAKRYLDDIKEIDYFVRKKLWKNPLKNYKKSKILKNKSIILLNNLFGHFKQEKIIPKGIERDILERKIKNYSSDLGKNELVLREILRKGKFFLAKSDQKIISSILNFENKINKISKALEKSYERRKKERALKKTIKIHSKMNSRGRTSKRLTEHISQELNKSHRERKIKPIV